MNELSEVNLIRREQIHFFRFQESPVSPQIAAIRAGVCVCVRMYVCVTESSGVGGIAPASRWATRGFSS